MVKRVSLSGQYERVKVERPSHVRVRAPEPAPASHAPRGFVEPRGVAGDIRKSNDVAGLLALANGLTSAQRKELLDQLALQNQLAAKAAGNPDLDLWAEAVKTALEASIGFGGGESYGVMLLKRLLGPSQCWRPVEQFMSASGLQELRRPERLAVYLLLARMLVDDCAQTCRFSGAPLSAKLVAGRTGDLGGLFERSFPGYIAAGLAPMVARQMQAA